MRTLLPRTGRRLLVAGAAVIALTAAGIAIADSGSPASTTVVSATFNANTAGPSHSDTCTPPSPADAFVTTDAVFTGTASNTDARFTGAVTIHVKSVYDSTKNAGSLTGHLDIQNPTTPSGHLHAHLTGVLVGTLAQGWLDGRLGDGSRFTGAFSSTFSTTGGFSSFNIGSGTGTNMAIASSGHCDHPHPNPQHVNPPHPNGPKHDDNDEHHHH